jgi:hypothetical protein
MDLVILSEVYQNMLILEGSGQNCQISMRTLHTREVIINPL